MCVYVNVASSRHRRSSQSKSWHTGKYQTRGEHYCWGGALLGETLSKLAVSSALLAIWPPRNTNNHEVFVFEPAFLLLRTQRRHKPTAESHSIQLVIASTAEQPSIGPAQRSKVHTAVRSCQPECDTASKQVGMKEQVKCCQESVCASILFFGKLKISLLFLCLYEVYTYVKANN